MNIHIAIKLDDRKTVDIGFLGDLGNFHLVKRLFLMTRNKQQYRHHPHQKMYQFHTPMKWNYPACKVSGIISKTGKILPTTRTNLCQ